MMDIRKRLFLGAAEVGFGDLLDEIKVEAGESDHEFAQRVVSLIVAMNTVTTRVQSRLRKSERRPGWWDR